MLDLLVQNVTPEIILFRIINIYRSKFVEKISGKHAF